MGDTPCRVEVHRLRQAAIVEVQEVPAFTAIDLADVAGIDRVVARAAAQDRRNTEAATAGEGVLQPVVSGATIEHVAAAGIG
ncbi:hypothetical protein D3C72_2460550 [compost metagenome]